MSNKKGRPRKKPEEKLRGYRYNLNLDRDLNDYLHEVAWQNRTSITQYINDLIRADMEENNRPKKITVEEIEDILGYRIEIV